MTEYTKRVEVDINSDGYTSSVLTCGNDDIANANAIQVTLGSININILRVNDEQLLVTAYAADWETKLEEFYVTHNQAQAAARV